MAATALGLGVEVTIVEALEAPLAPILGAELGRWFADLHREEGVRLLDRRDCSRAPAATAGSRSCCSPTADGSTATSSWSASAPCPATGWLRGSGLGERGVEVDTAGRTALPDVFAAGDASIPFDPRFGAHARTEHWDAAAWQGAAAAKAMLGEDPGTPPLPSFWSDQYGVRIQSRRPPAPRRRGRWSRAIPPARDFEAVFVRERRAGRRPRGRPPAGDPGPSQANRGRPPGRAATQGGGTGMTYVPVVDPDECSAHGDCVEIAPQVFRLDDTAVVIGTGPDDLILEAAEACPAVAISVVDQETGETVFP